MYRRRRHLSFKYSTDFLRCNETFAKNHLRYSYTMAELYIQCASLVGTPTNELTPIGGRVAIGASDVANA